MLTIKLAGHVPSVRIAYKVAHMELTILLDD